MLDFGAIKQVSILDVLGRYGVRLKGRGDWQYAKCPLPTHEAKENKTSFGVNVPGNFWLCHSDSCRMNKGNKKGGDVINLVQVMDKCSMLQAAQKLADWYGLNGNVRVSKPITPKNDDGLELAKNQQSENKPLSFVGFKDLDPAHEYLRGRGIRITTAEEFGIGYFGGRSSVIKDPYRIVIPIHNAEGMLVAYVGRSLDPKSEEKYHFPPGFLKTLELYNLHRVRDDVGIVVEGFFSVAHLFQEGYENCVGLMGSTISDVQLRLLKCFRSIVLMLDGDKAGREGTDVIAAKIAKQQFVTAVMLGDGQQPDHLSGDELRSVLGPILD